MAPPLLQLTDIHLTFGGTPLLTGAELSVGEGERLCLVGRNGSGKSTLLKIAAGLVEEDRGERFAQPTATIRYLPQEPDLSAFATTLAYVEAGLAPGDEPYRARYLLEQLGLTGEEAPANLSGGEARRAALARVLAPEPDILLLDEPTNHLDLPAIEWLESELKNMRSALVLISHDRRFLESLSRATVWLDRGITRRLDKGFAAFEAWRDEVLEQEERERHKLDRKIAMELDWLRYGVTARRKRNQRRLGELGAMRRERREQRRVLGNVDMTVSEAELSGTLVIEAKHIAKAYGERRIVEDFSIRIFRGERVAIVGANGAGKTTLVEMLTGRLAPDAGTVRLGANVAMARLDQTRSALDPEASLTEVLTDGAGDSVVVNGQSRHVVSYMKDFLFSPEQARTPVKVLSGGERARLLLAKALASPSNLLVLDEPTNDLDLETLDLLQEMLADYAGTVLLVSHDRDFLDRAATSVLMAEGQGRFVEYAGGYSDMVAQRGSGVDARAVEKAKAQKPPKPAAEKPAGPAPRKKLSFKDKHALETLPARITELEKTVAELAARLSDEALYARDPDGFARVSAKLAEVQGELSAAEERWLELEMLREELEG
ncbi:ATP-binding cassette domain-containing protein [Chelatococcus daeguensis]|uniref:ATP-binding protein Uup n=1 Tax=Chelatococcus sambhunathii TaxID=363953 RepID=A0ABP1ZYN9_9HYPH|nr:MULTISPECIES: ATP-binding cassette domain-containing protein [Chelatococcus]KZE27370.1 elongation factor 3 [Chelatococcus daeguensis]MBM3085579.1 ATP-binding cassette domain-containing protein [Chelatococcus daeguensis]CUA84191.1 ATPase components of ABC transporters with duplicated ATPase domains [Chelatococcus sambhunathii]